MEKSFLLVHAKSRLGLIRPPHGESNLNLGVEFGSDAVLDREFTAHFPISHTLISEFCRPEKVDPTFYYHVLAANYRELINQINDNLNAPKSLVTVGGDHSVALASLAAILRIKDPQKTGVIMLDSHGDIHQPSTSPTGNFHGMWLRPVLDQFEEPEINRLVSRKLPPENLIYLGNLDLESAEKEFVDQKGIKTYGQSQIRSPGFKRQFDAFLDGLTHLHLSLDIDVFTQRFAPATGMKIDQGLMPDDVFPILKRLQNFESLSLDLVEVNPLLKGHQKTVRLAQELIKTLFCLQ